MNFRFTFAWRVLLIFFCITEGVNVYAHTNTNNTHTSTIKQPFYNTSVATECDGYLGDNLLTDGSFGSGEQTILAQNPDFFTHDVNYVATMSPGAGNICVANSTANADSDPDDYWISIGDNSDDPNGYMLIVDSWYINQNIFEHHISGICDNTTYQFSFDAIALGKPGNDWSPDAYIDFYVNGELFFATQSINKDSTWHTYAFDYHVPVGQTDITFHMENAIPGGQWGDFAVDNIAMRQCYPYTDLDITGTPIICEGKELVLEANLELHGYVTPYYQWHFLDKVTDEWNIINGATYPTLIIPNITPDQGGTYLCAVASSPINATNNSCWGDEAMFSVTVQEQPGDTQISAVICEDETYFFGSTKLTMPGTYEEIFITSSGCDSTVILDLTLAGNPTADIQATICAGDSYLFNGTSYTEGGLYQAISPSQYGCDSTTNLSLLVIESLESNVTAYICEGQSYFLGNNSYNQTGIYSETFSASNSCDSIVYLELIVTEAIEIALSETICADESYELNGTHYNESGSYYAEMTAASGCDSIVSLELNVLQNYEIEINSSICAGESFNIGTTPYTTSGNYSELLTSSTGCDSLVHLELVVFEQIETNFITESLCAGESYTFGTETYTTSGVYTQTFLNSTACDSTVVLDLVFNETIEHSFSTTVCVGESYTLGTETYTESGEYSYTFQTLAGCDSIVQLSLEVVSEYESFVYESICTGNTIQIEGTNYAAAGAYELNLQAQNGCDSIVYLEIDVLPTYEIYLGDIICEGESYQVGIQNITTSGFHTINLLTSEGCDSTINVSLTVIPENLEEIDFDLCAGELFNDISIENDTVFIQYLQTNFGCDSTVVTNVFTLQPSELELEVELCQGENYEGVEYQTDTLLIDFFSNFWGCDSTVYTTVIVHPSHETTDTIIVDTTDENRFESEEDQALFNSEFKNPNDTLILSDTLTTIEGCDSIVNIMYIYLFPVNIHLNVTICEGNEYEGIPYFENTTLIEVYTAENGLDSTVYTHIGILPSYLDTLQASICYGDSYLAGGALQSTPGFYTDPYSTAFGCDSIIVTQLMVFEENQTSEIVEICAGEKAVIHGLAETVTGIYPMTLSNQNGCDSMSTVELIVHPHYDTMETVEICAGESYNETVLTEDTTFTEILNSINGCDSIITTNVLMIPNPDTTIYVVLPVGGEYNGVIYNEDFTTNDTIVSSTGCDSTITTLITLVDAVETFEDYVICEGEQINGISYYQDTIFTQHLLTDMGFDSLVTTQIIVNYPDMTFTADNSCDYSDGTTIEVVFSNQYGCDSTVLTTYTNQASEPVELNISLCAGEEYLGTVYTENTTLVQEDSNQFGCDSTTTYNISVLAAPQIELGEIEQFCATESFDIDLGNGLITTIWTEQADTLTGNTISEGGFYYVQATNANGCSVIDTIFVPAPMEINALISIAPPPCDVENGASIHIDTVYGGTAPYIFGLNNEVYQQTPMFDGLTGGVYEINIQDTNGCEFSEVYVIEETYEQINVELGEDLLIEWGDSIQLDAVVNDLDLVDQVIWTPSEGLSCDDCLTPMVTPNETVVYTVTVLATNGCEASDEVILRVEKERDIYIPNAFTPDSDGTNDVFTIYPGDGFKQAQLLQIYDRWGNQLFERTNFDPAIEELGWDGTFRGQMMLSGVYVYYVKVLFQDGVVKEYKGDVTLL